MVIQTQSHLSGEDFEERCAQVFRSLGFDVMPTNRGPDGGIDLVVTPIPIQTIQVIVQCKDWPRSKVGVKSIRELFGVVSVMQAKLGILVTTSSFTRPAVAFAKRTNIFLLDHCQLSQVESLFAFRQHLRQDILSICANGTTLKGADLHLADLQKVDLAHVNLSKANLRNAKLQGAYLRETDFTEADLQGADLQDAYLSFTNFHCADLRNANLENVDLSYNEKENEWAAYFDGARYNHCTKWPVGFDPNELSAVYVE